MNYYINSKTIECRVESFHPFMGLILFIRFKELEIRS